MKYEKPSNVSGAWVKGSEVQNGIACTLTTEAMPIQSQFKDPKTGNMKMQDVAKIKFKGGNEELNINLNRATIAGLIDAFGDDSKQWVGKVLTARTEKVVVSGKRVTAVYLVPQGFELSEDSNGYVVITRTGEKAPELPPLDEEVPPIETIPF